MSSAGERSRLRPLVTRDELQRALQARIGNLTDDPVLATRTDAVVLDVGELGSWTVQLRGGVLRLSSGRVRRPSTVISTTPDTLLEVVTAQRSGAEAFLAGDLWVRGDLSLALQLDGTIFRDASPTRWPRARTVLAGGFRTAYLEAGPPDGETVLLLHGLGATNASMLTTLWQLADRYRVLAPDLPGHGATSARRGRYDAAMFARWAWEFLDRTAPAGVDEPGAVVIGNSLGGRIALEVAFELPTRVRALVLLAPAPAFRRLRQFAPLVQVARHELAAVPLPITHRMAVAGLKALFAVPDRLPTGWYDAAADEFQRVFGNPSHRIAFFAALRQIYLDDAFGPRGFWTRLERLSTPALFIWGDRDRLVPVSFAHYVERAVPSATSVVLPGCGHVPQFELPDQTHALVHEFLGALPDVKKGKPGRTAGSTAS